MSQQQRLTKCNAVRKKATATTKMNTYNAVLIEAETKINTCNAVAKEAKAKITKKQQEEHKQYCSQQSKEQR